MTAVWEELRAAAARLAAAGVDTPRYDAETLAAHVLGVPRDRLVLAEGFSEAALAAYRDLVARRVARHPLQHLVGETGFRRLTVAVGPGVFVPRPETEVVVQAVLDRLPAPPARPVVVDLCSGCGVIPLSVAQEAPHARVHAVEPDPGALDWLRRNARIRADAGDAGIDVHAADIADPTVLAALEGTVDMVVSNPPYVALGEADLVAPEVKDHDPAGALWAGPDGLDVIRMVAAVARRLLRPGGQVVVEHSDRQGRSAPALFTAADGWVEVADHPDLTQRDRYVTACREDR